ncbi:MAG: hypothetical protein SW833_17180 [Cyanobacteriota bacterium]|nr:hypothetical protein [Cyanobacteriota bacterium]
MTVQLNAKQLWGSTILAAIALLSASAPGLAETVALAGSPTQAITLSGQSGGAVGTPDCGQISATPNHILNVSERIGSMKVSVQSANPQATLLIDGPGGRFCAVAAGNKLPEIPGLWMPGQYRVYVGNLGGDRSPYTLSISQ